MIDKKFIGKEYSDHIYEVGREKMKEYALAINDENPYYFDTELGAKSEYGDCIAPPNFASVYNLDRCSHMFFDPEIKLNYAMLVHGEMDFQYIKPVKPGDVLTTKGKIVDIAEKGPNDTITFEGRSYNQDGDLMTIGTATFVIRGGN